MNDTDDIHDYLLLELPHEGYPNDDHLNSGSFGIYRVSKHRSYPGYDPCFSIGLRSLNDDCVNLHIGFANEYFKPFRDVFSWGGLRGVVYV